VLAVDPSSPVSKGSILGDKTRMAQLAVSDAAFVRPSPTGGSLGGVARKTRESILICEAAGYDVVLVETVGVGQSEMDIIRLADITLLVLAPGLGDDIQAMKAGLLEVADILVVNKADCKGADILAMDLETVSRQEGATNQARVSMTVATENKGITELLERIAEVDSEHRDSGEREKRRRGAHDQEVLDWCLEILRPRLLAEITKRDLPLLGDPRLKAKEILEEQ